MIPYMIGKLAPNSTHSTRGLVKYAPNRGCFRAVPSQNGEKFVTSPPATIVERVAGRRGVGRLNPRRETKIQGANREISEEKADL